MTIPGKLYKFSCNPSPHKYEIGTYDIMKNPPLHNDIFMFLGKKQCNSIMFEYHFIFKNAKFFFHSNEPLIKNDIQIIK